MAHQQHRHPAESTFSLDAESVIYATWTDLTVSAPAGSAGFNTTIHFHLDGSFGNGTTQVLGGYTTAANTTVAISIATPTLTLGNGSYYWVSQNGAPPARYLSAGLLTNLTGNDDLAVSLFVIPNQPFTLDLQLQTAAYVSGPANHGMILTANTEFSHTFSFATDRPVFDLPAGYTANSLDAGIVDNTYTLPTPEPANVGIACLLPALLVTRRSQRRRVH